MNTFFNESPKCLVYRYIFDNNVLQFYLDRPLNYIYKPYICIMRISAHNLNIETGHLGDSLKNVFISLIKLSFILCLNSHIKKSTWLTY
jgi:hypothetical protein